MVCAKAARCRTPQRQNVAARPRGGQSRCSNALAGLADGLALDTPASRADGDTVTVRVYDFDHKTLSDPVWPTLKYDISDVVYHEGDLALAGVCYTADTYTCDLKDPALQADYQTALAKLGGERNLTPLSMSDDGRLWLFGVSGPTEPGAYYVFDRRTKSMTLAANRQPDLPAAKLGVMERFVFHARDGTAIPGYLTRPPGDHKGPLPLIVMPHGGPEARDSYAFDSWGQILATRGYLVFQPNFRGSSGYGRHFAEAGYGQWGGRMQDDLTDGVQDLIKSGRADPARVCIFGASYGGYAALYGGAQSPGLYKCVASFAGVSDLRALVDWERHTRGHEARYRYAARAIGIGVLLDFSALDPIKALVWAAVINGVISVPILVVMMLVASRRDQMGRFVATLGHRVFGWAATAVMAAAVVAMIWTTVAPG